MSFSFLAVGGTNPSILCNLRLHQPQRIQFFFFLNYSSGLLSYRYYFFLLCFMPPLKCSGAPQRRQLRRKQGIQTYWCGVWLFVYWLDWLESAGLGGWTADGCHMVHHPCSYSRRPLLMVFEQLEFRCGLCGGDQWSWQTHEDACCLSLKAWTQSCVKLISL